MTAPADIWLTRKDVSDRMQVPVATLAQWASRGRGPRSRHLAATPATGYPI